MNYEDPPSPRAVVRGIVGAAAGMAGVAAVITFLATGRVAWQFVALFLALWGAWSFFSSLFDTLLSPLGRLFGSALTGGAMPPGAGISIEQQTVLLERLLAGDPPPPPQRAILAGIRLAEIYRTHQKDHAKAEALIARLASRYPDAPQLKHVRGR